MERVDVVVVGGGAAGLAAAQAAAAGGVRVIIVEQNSLPRPTRMLSGMSAAGLQLIGLPPSVAERSFYTVEVNNGPAVRLGDRLAIHAVPAAAIHAKLFLRAKDSGVEIRDGTPAARAELDPEGWRLTLYGGEPVRAPILIVADGARSRTLQALGIAEAQRYTQSGAEIVSFVCGRWNVSEKVAQTFASYRVLEQKGPLGRVEILAGKNSLTIAAGPVWRGIATPQDASAPSTDAQTMLDIVRKKLNLAGPPETVEREEWRLDALPNPATFDGGMVIGEAAGLRKREPLTAIEGLVRSGRLAGSAAARAVLDKTWSARDLTQRLGPEYTAIFNQTIASVVELEAHGLRSARNLPTEFWRHAD